MNLRPYPNVNDNLQEQYQNTNFAQGHYDGITIGFLDNAEVSCLKDINLRDVHAVQVPAVKVPVAEQKLKWQEKKSKVRGTKKLYN
jgi:hypothetical protein